MLVLRQKALSNILLWTLCLHKLMFGQTAVKNGWKFSDVSL